MAAQHNKKCAHPACHCQARPGSDYCSTYCEGEAKTADIQCNCGHSACAHWTMNRAWSRILLPVRLVVLFARPRAVW